jgi:hypothetical protein
MAWDSYNRDGHDPKRLNLSAECTKASEEGSRVYPDIIVHRRGTDDNLLVIEMKKSTNSIPRHCDLEKLKEYRNQLGYNYALFVEFRISCTEPGIDCTQWIQ